MTTDSAHWAADLEALRQLPQRYARAVDGRDIDAVAALFHPDGNVEGLRGTAPVPAYIQGMRDNVSPFAASMHLLADPLIELTPGADTATMDTYAVVYQLRAPDSPDGDLTLGMRYLDTVVRTSGSWLIKHRRAVNVWTRGSLPR